MSKLITLTENVQRRFLAPQLTWFALWLGTTVIALFLTPSNSGHGTHTQMGLPPCPSVLLFGRPCPGCGLTTCFTALVHGDLVSAFRANAFGLVIYTAFTITAFYGAYHWLKRNRVDYNTKSFNRALVMTLVLYITYGGIRFASTNPVEYSKQWLTKPSGFASQSSRTGS